VIFDATGRYSEIRQIEWVSGQTVNWPARPLPPRYSSIVGLVRLERVEPFYSWMLTVRKRASGPANVDVVVFSKRDFNELSEQVYVGDLRRFTLGADGAPGIINVDDNGEDRNGNGTLDPGEDNNGNGVLDGVPDDVAEIGHPDSDDQLNNRVTIDWDPALYPTQPDKPPLRHGGFIFDAANALWYRILSVEEAPTATSAVLALDKAISRDNTEDLIYQPSASLNNLDAGEDKNTNSELDRGGIIIPKGVVAVFPLETKLLQ